MTLQEYIELQKDKGEDASYSEIARKIPCHVSYISMIANGKRIPSYEMARRIEQITDGAVKRENWYPTNE